MMSNHSSRKVFLGGTCNHSQWRTQLIPMLTISYFNPVVDEWNETAHQEEIRQRVLCDFCLYVITPKMEGFYSIAEVVDDSNKQPQKTILCLLDEDEGSSFSNTQKKSLKAVSALVQQNGAKVFSSLKEVADYLNKD
jgi:hypothetical protein